MNENILVNTWHGLMIVNRKDRKMVTNTQGCGVGIQLLEGGAFDKDEVTLVTSMLQLLCKVRQRPICAFDIGANIGCYSLVWARELGEMISIHAVEAQPQLFYQLCGNIALNNLRNIRAINVAVGAQAGTLSFAEPNYTQMGSFGSLELIQTGQSEHIGQDLSDSRSVTVPMFALEQCADEQPDFIKIDIEGMEADVLFAAEAYLSRHKPVLHFEHIKLRDQKQALYDYLAAQGYVFNHRAMDTLAVHQDDAFIEATRAS